MLYAVLVLVYLMDLCMGSWVWKVFSMQLCSQSPKEEHVPMQAASQEKQRCGRMNVAPELLSWLL